MNAEKKAEAAAIEAQAAERDARKAARAARHQAWVEKVKQKGREKAIEDAEERAQEKRRLAAQIKARKDARQILEESGNRALQLVFQIGRCPECGQQAWTIEAVRRSRDRMIASASCSGCRQAREFKSTTRVLPHMEWPEFEAVKAVVPLKRFLGGDFYDDPSLGTPTRRATILAEIQSFVYERDGGQCVKCGSRANLQFDHIVPYSKGGGDQADNLQLLCRECNLSKGARFA